MIRDIKIIEFKNQEEHLEWLINNEGNIREINLYTDNNGELVCRYVEL